MCTERAISLTSVYNTWGEKMSTAAWGLSKHPMTVDISDYSGDPVNLKMYSRESVTWAAWASIYVAHVTGSCCAFLG